MLVFSHKMVFIKNETALLCVTMPEREGHLQLQSSARLFDVAFSIKKFSFCGALLNVFWYGKETVPKSSS